jgi:two-component system response regulator AtoC
MDKPPVKVVVIDDSATDLELLQLFLRRLNIDSDAFIDPEKALKVIAERVEPTLIISDISMPQMNGFEILEKLKTTGAPAHVVFISGHDQIEYPIKAMRLGALDYMTKPLNLQVFEARVRSAIANIATRYELQTVKTQIFSGHSFESFVGKSQAIQKIYEMIMKVSEYDSNVLILGESGVGKERVARAIHERSRRAKGEFVAVNCASLPENLIESELFGYTKGSFTGADKDTPGLFMIAHGGTIFLDEIGELPASLQAKLLRVLQEQEIRPVGAKKSVKIDVRVLCATHRDLQTLVAERKFREDLYFRLNVIPIYIPPLRERREDLEVLVPHVLNKLNRRWGLMKTLSPDVWKLFEHHQFPGNVRELENMIERAYILSAGREIQKSDFVVTTTSSRPTSMFNLNTDLPSLREIELTYIREILSRVHTKEEAAQILGIGRKTLYRKEFEIQDFFSSLTSLHASSAH